MRNAVIDRPAGALRRDNSISPHLIKMLAHDVLLALHVQRKLTNRGSLVQKQFADAQAVRVCKHTQ